jgi:tetratricopeptide (TPR) repeat protein
MELGDLSLDQLGDAVNFLFAGDLDAHGKYVLFVDAYEALAGGVSRAGSVTFVDSWLRDLLGQLDHGLTVVASRESLRWDRHDREWQDRIRPVPVVALPFQARLELLRALGVRDPSLGEEIARDCDGVPYFLHVAHESGSTARTYARVEERFLHHVTPGLVRMLEVLSVARVFDRDIFRQVAGQYELQGDAHTWETLIAYSFISAAGAQTLQMHQLMARAIQSRLPAGVLTEVHERLRDIWSERANRAPSIEAWREAAFHAASAQPADVSQLLTYADHLGTAGKPGLDSMRTDLLGLDEAGRYGRLAGLLAAEAALLLGDAHAAERALHHVPPTLPSTADEIDARVALAAANAARILGRTAEALARYGEIWPGHPGPARLDAGMWHADLDMAQGRFVDAIRTADAVAEASPPERVALRADLARLRCLAFRFAFDPAGAARHARVAKEAYAAAEHQVGLANIATNEAEILALTASEDTVRVAMRAVETQRRLGADHEVGKSLTALVLARLALGDLDAAGRDLDEAVRVLDGCGYRSGRARAELVRALWHARAGRHDEAAASAAWAVAEFEAVEVYPTLVMVAAALLDRIGRIDRRVSVAAERAERSVQPLDTPAGLQSSIAAFVARLVADDWDEVYAAAVDDGARVAGFYHKNVRVGPHLVRMAIPDADSMDLHLLPEADVLAVVGRHLADVPRLRSVNRRPPYQIHEFVEGVVLNDIAPKGARLPGGAIDRFAAFFARLGEVPVAELPPLPPDWPGTGDSSGVAGRLLAVTRSVHEEFREQYAGLWRALGIPDDPFEPLELDALHPRPFRLIHCDVHRQNIIVRDGGGYVFVDWELALVGDPVYEIAVHLHKMAYGPDEDAEMRAAWAAACQADQWPDWAIDLDRYLAHERVKSTIVDSVRYAKVVAADPGELSERSASLARKLTLARQVWHDLTPVDPAEVAAHLRRRAGI